MFTQVQGLLQHSYRNSLVISQVPVGALPKRVGFQALYSIYSNNCEMKSSALIYKERPTLKGVFQLI